LSGREINAASASEERRRVSVFHVAQGAGDLQKRRADDLIRTVLAFLGQVNQSAVCGALLVFRG
jgi:hypothetical protein